MNLVRVVVRGFDVKLNGRYIGFIANIWEIRRSLANLNKDKQKSSTGKGIIAPADKGPI